MRPWIRAALAGLLVVAAPAPAPAGPPEDPTADLDHPDPERREKALVELGKLGKDKKREAQAIKLLTDPDWGVAIEATKTLVAVGAGPACDALALAAVEGEIVALRQAAARAAAQLDAPAALARWLYLAGVQRTPAGKARAVLAAGTVATGAALKALRPFTKSNDAPVEAAGIFAVGSLARDATVKDVVLEFLVDACAARRAERKRFLGYAAAIDALTAIDDPRARAALALEVAQQPDDDDYVASRAAKAIAVGGEAAAEAVLAAVGKAKGPAAERRLLRLAGRLRLKALVPHLTSALAHKDAGVRTDALAALAWVKDPSTWQAIEPLLDDPSPDVRREAWSALARIEAPSSFRARAAKAKADASEEVRLQYVVELFDGNEVAAVPVLAELFGDAAWRVAAAALAAAGAAGTADDLERFLPLLPHRDWRVRAAAFEALGRLRAHRAIPHLAAGLDDKDPVVKGVCWANLQILAGQRLSAERSTWMKWYEAKGHTLALVKRSRLPPKADGAPDGSGAPGRYAHEGYGRKQGVEVLQKARILVMTGAWDHVERVLDHLRIGHVALRAQQIDEVGLNPNQVVLVNCEGNVDSKSAERLKWFTTVGGYVISTDWAVTKAVAICWPGYIVQYSASSTGNDNVAVEQAPFPHPFTAGVFEGVPSLSWWLEIQAFPLTIVRPHRVEVLVDSREMRWKYGSSPLAATYRHGLGKVTHAVSHFFLQEEALASASTPRDRLVFAADRLGIPMADLRTLVAEGRFPNKLDESVMRELAPAYSMFRILVNVVGEKSRWVENL